MPMALAEILSPRSAASHTVHYRYWAVFASTLLDACLGTPLIQPPPKSLRTIVHPYGGTTAVYSGVYSIQGIVVPSPRTKLMEAVACICIGTDAVSNSRLR